jgi:rhodanese-related sulfurtransferase
MSARAALTLRKLGISNARALVGGFEQWKAAGHPVQGGKN